MQKNKTIKHFIVTTIDVAYSFKVYDNAKKKKKKQMLTI